MLDNRALMYCIIVTAIVVSTLTSINIAYAFIAVVVASIASGVLAAYTYSGEYLRARDVIPLTSVIGFGLGYLIGISASAIVCGLKGELLDLALLGVRGEYVTLLIISIILAYFTGFIIYPRIWKTKKYRSRRR